MDTLCGMVELMGHCSGGQNLPGMLALRIMHEDSVLNGLVRAFFLIINSDNDSLYYDVYYTVVHSNEKLKMTYISNNGGLVNKLRCSHMINLFSH